MAGTGYIKGRENVSLALSSSIEVSQATPADLQATVDVATLAATTIAVGAGAVSAGVQRTTLASDDPAVASIGALDDAAVTTDAQGSMLAFLRGLIVQGVALALKIPALGAAAKAASSPVTLATDDPEVLAIGAIDDAGVTTDAQGSLSAKLRGVIIQGVAMAAKIPALGTAVMTGASPVTLATDDPEVLAIGAVADAKVATDTTGSISAKLRGLVALAATNAAKIPALGQTTASASTPVVLANNADIYPFAFKADAAPTAISSSSASMGQITEGTEVLIKSEVPFYWTWEATGNDADTDDTPVGALEIAKTTPAPAAPNNFLKVVTLSLSGNAWKMSL